MAMTPNPEHLEILGRGVNAWNRWRELHPDVQPFLLNADLIKRDFEGIDFQGAYLHRANFAGANLSGANLYGAELVKVSLNGANVTKADLRYSNLSHAYLKNADLTNANLYRASLSGVNLVGVKLDNADFTKAYLIEAVFGNNDLSTVNGLESIKHTGPSTIGIDTIIRSKGNIPEIFLRGCGVPEDFITHMRSVTVQPIQFYSCFISYSTKDEELARRLYSRMRDEHMRVWFAPEDVKGGEKLYEQIESAIQIHDRLLLVLSESSMQSEWVMTEIRNARNVELREKRRKLFPIRLVDFEKIKTWTCFDADTGKDLAKEVREYFIPDFSNWKDHDSFEKAFKRLLRDLKAEGKT